MEPCKHPGYNHSTCPHCNLRSPEVVSLSPAKPVDTSRLLLGRFQVGPYPVEIISKAGQLDEDDPDGLFDPNLRPRTIQIAQRVIEGSDSERRAVVYHELVHLALHLFAIELKPDVEEQVAEALAFVLEAAHGQL